MQDHSYKMLFLGASALMCAAAMFASQAAPWLPVDDHSLAAAADSFSSPQRTQFAADAGLLSDANARGAFLPVAKVETRGSTATIVPNGTSCPAGNAATLVTPSGALAAGAPPSQPPLQSGATLGTGSSCPPAHADARTDVSAGLSLATPKPLAANGPSGRSPRS